MTLTSKDIAHVGRLARLKLTDKEINQYRKEIAGILKYVGQLPAKSGKALIKRQAIAAFDLREDVVAPWEETEKQEALAAAPLREGKQIKVKRILG